MGPTFLVDIGLLRAKATGKPFGFDAHGRSFVFPILHLFETLVGHTAESAYSQGGRCIATAARSASEP